MCGIFAFITWDANKSMRETLEVLFAGLKRLEYRGYDSAGLAMETTTSPFLVRECGKIANLK